MPGPQSIDGSCDTDSAGIRSYHHCIWTLGQSLCWPGAGPHVLFSCPLSGSLPGFHNPVTGAQVSVLPAQQAPCHHPGCLSNSHGTYRAVQVFKYLPDVSPIGRRQEPLVTHLYIRFLFPIAAVIHYHPFSGLKQQKLIIFQFKVQNGFDRLKSKLLAEPFSF